MSQVKIMGCIIRLAEGLELVADEVTMKMPQPETVGQNSRWALVGQMFPVVTIKLTDQSLMELAKFFRPINAFLGTNLDNAIRELKVEPKPGAKRLIDLS